MSKKYNPIIDGDGIAYAISAVMEPQYLKHVESTHSSNPDISIEQLYTYLSYLDNEMPRLILDKVDSHCITLLENKIREINEYCDSDKMILLIGGSNSYRKNIYKHYKESRSKITKLQSLTRIKKLLQRRYNATWVTGIETDDACIITYNHYRNSGEPIILVHTDKDLKQCVGEHLKYPTYYDKQFIQYSVSESEALIHLLRQVVQGDGVDGVSGIQGRGEKFVDQLIATNTLVPQRVLEEYIIRYGNIHGMYQFSKNMLLVHMLTDTDDVDFTVPSWTKLKKTIG